MTDRPPAADGRGSDRETPPRGPEGPSVRGPQAPPAMPPALARLTHHHVQALVGGSLRHDVLNAGLVDVHGPPVLDHGARDVEVLGAVHLEVAVEEVVAGFICKGWKGKAPSPELAGPEEGEGRGASRITHPGGHGQLSSVTCPGTLPAAREAGTPTTSGTWSCPGDSKEE